MNEYQLRMFDALEDLVASGDTFYRQEFVLDGARYWIYNYRLASFSDFERPFGRECRGHMFEVTPLGRPVRLASLPMQKFHNMDECPLTMGLDLSKVDTVELKADGSLMSTFIHKGLIRVKSKGSLFSEQAVDALDWLKNDGIDLASCMWVLEQNGWTTNLEWCAPHNRIVIGYQRPHLKVLNVRHRETGQYMPREKMERVFDKMHLIDRVDTQGMDVSSFVQSIHAMQDDIEGYVCRIGDLWFKVKTEKYMSLHHAKDSINNPRRLFEAVVDEGVDDLRSMFAHDQLAMDQINEMQEKVTVMFNHLVRCVEDYYKANIHKDRKDYAIGAQTLSLNGIKLLGLAMNMYLGKDPEFKNFLKSKYKELGFRDTSVGPTND